MFWRAIEKSEKEKLLQELRDEAYWPLGVVLKCACGLLALVVMGLVGGAQVENVPGSFGVAGANRSLHSPERPPMAEARRVFNERRARYIKAYPDSYVAREAALTQAADANSDGGYHHYGQYDDGLR